MFRKKVACALVLTLFPAMILAFLQSAQADSSPDLSCDSLYSTEAGSHTIWDFFSHPCPPEPDDSQAPLPGVGVTIQGFRTFPTLSNPLGVSVSENGVLLNNQVTNGYGGGIGINGWLSPNLGLRFEAGFLNFPAQAGGSSFQAIPVTLGVEVRLIGSRDIFLYAAADGGAVVNGQNTANLFVGTGVSPYMQGGIGINIFFLQIEADYATIFQPFETSLHSNPLFFIPLSVGVHM